MWGHTPSLSHWKCYDGSQTKMTYIWIYDDLVAGWNTIGLTRGKFHDTWTQTHVGDIRVLQMHAVDASYATYTMSDAHTCQSH